MYTVCIVIEFALSNVNNVLTLTLFYLFIIINKLLYGEKCLYEHY